MDTLKNLNVESHVDNSLQIVVPDVKQLKESLNRIPILKIIKQKTIFSDLHQVIDDPMFSDFARSYFTTWTKTQVVTQLCQMYIDLDKFSTQINDPFEKIKLLQEVILKQYDNNCSTSAVTDGTTSAITDVTTTSATSVVTDKTTSATSVVTDKTTSATSAIANGTIVTNAHKRSDEASVQSYYASSKVLTDVANIMEYDVTRRFIEKYFLNWDVSDFVSVLINMYKSLDRYKELTQQEKFGILHNLIDDKHSRRTIAAAVSSWKSGSSSIRYSLHLPEKNCQ